jgi:hypothetical protein
MRVEFRVFYRFHEILGFCAFLGSRKVLRFLGFREFCGFLRFITSSELAEVGHVSSMLMYVIHFLKKFRLILKFERKNNILLICL